MQEHSQGDMILEEEDGPYEKGDILLSFHHQARRPMSRKALLADFFIGLAKEMRGAIFFWLRHSSDGLITGCSSSPRSFPWTLPAMVCCIQRGLRALTEAFCRPPTTKREKGTISCLATDQIPGSVCHTPI